ncbi:hypothetical protein HGG82_13020 [Marinomonas sp. M1K-6]|uniref:Uncharacterized protein n=1 Tax=Marinomonas profundi TaxID=2726122 RepID=A0A847QZ57_9GAMM|nr:RhuM family protein [Marinomonas profundi]NLQ18529.1 hypothetical protein [Marinomonas profundi]UDV04401.1 virulence RhuM family protein [Marinomonas profundi]
MNELILYTTEDGKNQIQLRADNGTVWLSQLDMAELFLTSKQNVAKHLKAIFFDGELVQEAVVNQWLTTASDGKKYKVVHYNLDAILAVGYRVRSPRGVQFRRWASTFDEGVRIFYTVCRKLTQCRLNLGLKRT